MSTFNRFDVTIVNIETLLCSGWIVYSSIHSEARVFLFSIGGHRIWGHPLFRVFFNIFFFSFILVFSNYFNALLFWKEKKRTALKWIYSKYKLSSENVFEHKVCVCVCLRLGDSESVRFAFSFKWYLNICALYVDRIIINKLYICECEC